MTAATAATTLHRTARPAPPRPRLHLVPAPAVRARRAAVLRRRRLVAALVAGAAVIGLARAGAALGGAPLAAPGGRPHVVSYVVEPGDTLWSVAAEVAPDRDPREVVDALVEARGGTHVVPGETITWLAG